MQSFDSNSEDSEWSLYQDYYDSALETSLSTSPSVTLHRDGPSCDIGNSALSSIQDFVQLYEEVVSTSSSSTSSSPSMSSSILNILFILHIIFCHITQRWAEFDTDDSVMSSIRDFVQLCEEVVTTSYSSSSADSGDEDGEMLNTGDTNHLQD